jgi:SAM-dependent methyltransferase
MMMQAAVARCAGWGLRSRRLGGAAPSLARGGVAAVRWSSSQLRADIGEGVGGSLDEWSDPDFAAAWTETGWITTNPDRPRQVEFLASAAVAAAKAAGVPCVLDLGCGSGLITEALLGRECEVVGVDGSEAMLGLAADKVPAATLAQATFEELASGSTSPSAAAALAKGPFGAITVAQALHEAPDEAVRGVLQWVQSAEVLAPGGVLLVLERYELESGGADAGGIWCASLTCASLDCLTKTQPIGFKRMMPWHTVSIAD